MVLGLKIQSLAFGSFSLFVLNPLSFSRVELVMARFILCVQQSRNSRKPLGLLLVN